MMMNKIVLLFCAAVLLNSSLEAESTQSCAGRQIVSQSPYITHALDFFGMKECIVGASVYDGEVAADLPRTGKVIEPDGEAIERLHPDFIFSSDWTTPETMAAVTPDDAKGFILHGFASMEQVENNLYTIGNVLNIVDFETKVKAFKTAWREAAHSVNAKHKKVLLLSACSKAPYSYGRKSYLGDLFAAAGFDVVDRTEQVRTFTIDASTNELDAFINTYRPDFIFGFVPYTKGGSCAVLETNRKLPIVYLDGDLFMHPAPTLLKGLQELKAKEGTW